MTSDSAPAVDHAPFELDADIYSESVLLAAISTDAQAAVFTRLCRYPSATTSWIWVYAFGPHGAWSFVDDRAPCSPDPLDLAADNLRYPTGPDHPHPAAGEWRRIGSRDEPTGAAMGIDVPAHPTTAGRTGPGPVPLHVEIQFTPRYRSGGTLAGRSEVLGTARAHVTAGEIDFGVQGVGQWHEQEQSAPRFRSPFTYASLQGEGVALVGLGGPRRSGGFLRGEIGDQVLVRAEFGAPDGGGHHEVVCETRTGEVLTGTAQVTHAYHLPVYGRGWSGSFVTAEISGRRLSGFVNRWRPDAPPLGHESEPPA